MSNIKIKNTNVETTPFAHIDIMKITEPGVSLTLYTIKLYWTANPGVNGYQVGYQIFKHHSLTHENKTNVHGSCKIKEAYQNILHELCHGHINSSRFENIIMSNRIGGNYSKFNIKKLTRN